MKNHAKFACPFCGEFLSDVVLTRVVKRERGSGRLLPPEERSVKRHRECQSCFKRFTSYERIDPRHFNRTSDSA